MFTTKLLEYLTIVLIVMAGIMFTYQMNKAGYERGYDQGYGEGFSEAYNRVRGSYDRGYQACVEEYNLYLPYE